MAGVERSVAPRNYGRAPAPSAPRAKGPKSVLKRLLERVSHQCSVISSRKAEKYTATTATRLCDTHSLNETLFRRMTVCKMALLNLNDCRRIAAGSPPDLG